MCLDTWMQLCNCITSLECRLSLKRCGPSVSIISNVLQWNMKWSSCYVISMVLHVSRIMDSILAHCLAWQLLQGFKSTWKFCIIVSLFSSCADGNAWHIRPVYPEFQLISSVDLHQTYMKGTGVQKCTERNLSVGMCGNVRAPSCLDVGLLTSSPCGNRQFL